MTIGDNVEGTHLDMNRSLFYRIILPISLALILWSGCHRKPLPEDEEVEQVKEPASSEASPAIDVLIDSKAKTLTVFRDKKVVEVFQDAAFGTAGVGIKKKRGDGITPVGIFIVDDIRPSSRFKIFIALNYPSKKYAEDGLVRGVIKEPTYKKIVSALDRLELPPQNTPLGGYIGIHGIGKGDSKIHKAINWTDGCIALDNQQIDRLARLLRKGAVVQVQ